MSIIYATYIQENGQHVIFNAGGNMPKPLTDEEARAAVKAANAFDGLVETGDKLLEVIGHVTGIEPQRKAFIQALAAAGVKVGER